MARMIGWWTLAVATLLFSPGVLPPLASRIHQAWESLGGENGHASGDRFSASLPTPVVGSDQVRGGQRVLLRWPSLGERAREMELVFSIDDGRRYDVRVSPQLEGDEFRYEWRVPNVSVGSARIWLRAGIDGHEVRGPASPPFRIVADPMRPLQRWSRRGAEWWEDERGETLPLPGLAPAAPILVGAPGAESLTVPPRVGAESPSSVFAMFRSSRAGGPLVAAFSPARVLPRFRPTRE